MLNFDREDLLLELAAIAGRLRAALALERKRIELLARDAVLARDVVRSDALRCQVVRLAHVLGEREACYLEVRPHRHARHAFDAAPDRDIDDAGGDQVCSEVDRLHRFSDNKEFVIVSLMMLIDSRDEAVEDDAGSYEFRPTYQQLAMPLRSSVEAIAEAEYWRTTTFVTLLESMRALDPRAIERDAFFVYPGTENDGISSLDLLGDASWKYLTDHPLRFS